MANLEKTLPSGSVLVIQLASFGEGNKLLKAVMKELRSVDINIGAKAKTLSDFFSLELNDETINTFKNLLSTLLSSDAISEALWACAGRATYNKQKVIQDLFEDEKARGDYLVVMKEILLHNLRPFF